MPGEALQQPEAGASVGAEGEGKKKMKEEDEEKERREGLRVEPLVIPCNLSLIPLVSGVDCGSSEPGVCDVSSLVPRLPLPSLIPRLHCGHLGVSRIQWNPSVMDTLGTW